MKKLQHIVYTLVIGGFLLSGCSNELDLNPQGVLSDSDLSSPEAVEGLVISAYAILDNVTATSGIDTPVSNWSFGDVRSDDAYKGGGGTGDYSAANLLEVGPVNPDNWLVYQKWRVLQFAVKRCNNAIRALEGISEEVMPNKNIRIGEVKMLRGHYYFDLKRHFYQIPWIDESISEGEEAMVPNNLSSEQLWTNIENDLLDAIDRLPVTQSEQGRVTSLIAKAYLTKVYMYQHKYTEALAISNDVVGAFSLQNDLEALYSDPTVEHDGENIFAVEVNIGGGGDNNGNLNMGDLLTSPPGPAYGGGDNFHKPSQNLVNAFKVNAAGLPLLDTFNDTDLAPDDTTTPIDPRLDLAIGRPGIPWKDYTGEVYGSAWIRDLITYGPYSKKKNIISPNSSLRANPGGFPWALGALNVPIMKYSDLLLLRAEAFIETGDTESARLLINEVRQRAMDTPWVMKLDGSGYAANYQIGLYPSQGFDQTLARKAVQMERRLELCLEGHRFYDLVRWGEAAAVINQYFTSESENRSYLGSGSFQANKNEYLPIPIQEIENSHGILTQNEFYQ